MPKSKYTYNPKLYSSLFYPHVSTLGKLLTRETCCHCGSNVHGQAGSIHHCAYKLPNGQMVKTCEFDMLGILLYPLCNSCHKDAHDRYWNKRFSRNTSEYIDKLNKNWNRLAINFHYKRTEGDKIWNSYPYQ